MGNIPHIKSDDVAKKRKWTNDFILDGLILDEPVAYQQILGSVIKNCYSLSIYQPYGQTDAHQLYKRYPIYFYDMESVNIIGQLTKVSIVRITGNICYSKRTRAIRLIGKKIEVYNESEKPLRTADQVREILKQLKNDTDKDL